MIYQILLTVAAASYAGWALLTLAAAICYERDELCGHLSNLRHENRAGIFLFSGLAWFGVMVVAFVAAAILKICGI